MDNNKVIEIFCQVNDFLKEFYEFETKKLISKGETMYRNRKAT